MSAPASSPPLWMLATSLLAGIGLVCAPNEVTSKLRTVVRDTLRPGQVAVYGIREWTRDHYDTLQTSWRLASSSTDLIPNEAAQREQFQRLQTENAWLREQLRNAKLTAIPSQSTEPLLVPDVVEARVLGEETVQRVQRSTRSLLGIGAQSGVEGTALVLAGNASHIDLGIDSLLRSDHLILAGRAVVGKIGQVGRFTSTLLPVTDKQYRGMARLARPAGDGLEFGAEGILEGDGSEFCRLNFIQSTEPVSVGDSLYTAAADGSLGVPLLYGTVVEAELPIGAPHWSIRVKPAADLTKLRTVQIMRTQVNPLRLSAH